MSQFLVRYFVDLFCFICCPRLTAIWLSGCLVIRKIIKIRMSSTRLFYSYFQPKMCQRLTSRMEPSLLPWEEFTRFACPLGSNLAAQWMSLSWRMKGRTSPWLLWEVLVQCKALDGKAKSWYFMKIRQILNVTVVSQSKGSPPSTPECTYAYWPTNRRTVSQIDSQIDWQTDWLADRLTDQQTDEQSVWQTGKLTGRQTDWQTDRQTAKLTDRQTDWPTNRRIGSQTDRKTHGRKNQDWPTNRRTNRQTDRQTEKTRLTDKDRQSDKQTNRQTDRQIDRVVTTFSTQYLQTWVFFTATQKKTIFCSWSSHGTCHIERLAPEGKTMEFYIRSGSASDCIQETRWHYGRLSINLLFQLNDAILDPVDVPHT